MNELVGTQDVRLRGCRRVLIDDCQEVVVNGCPGAKVMASTLAVCANNLIDRRGYLSNVVADIPEHGRRTEKSAALLVEDVLRDSYLGSPTRGVPYRHIAERIVRALAGDGHSSGGH